MTHFIPTKDRPTEYGQSREEREATLACLRGHCTSWMVVQRKCNYSAFSGYHYTPSAWSLVKCQDCGRIWRTKAGYVDNLPDAPGRDS